jgi:twitching motility protein PilT
MSMTFSGETMCLVTLLVGTAISVSVAARIEQFVDAIFRLNGQKLVLQTGDSVWIMVDGLKEIILEKNVRTKQIDRLVSPVLSEADREKFLSIGESKLDYNSRSGKVRIHSVRDESTLKVQIEPVHSSIPPASTTGALRRSPVKSMGDGVARIGQDVPMTRSFQLGAQSGSQKPEIDAILTEFVHKGASDLHLTTGQPPMIRKDGEMCPLSGHSEPMSSHQIEEWMLAVANKRIRDQFQNTHDADYAYEVEGVSRYRMNLFLDRNGTGAVIRTIPSKILSFEQLDLPDVIRRFCGLPKGLVLVTGPTGSGKSTTLAAMIDLINHDRKDHIITIEDPIEFVHTSQTCLINQREVHTHTESFSRALRAALREDPDIVLVGEMRDLETVHIALETAETGHLVFGTLHTNTAASTVDRVIDQFPTDRQSQIRVMLSESLKGVIAQTLCKKIGGGRVACHEILVVNTAVANLIREGKTFQIASMMQAGRSLGMQTNSDAMMALITNGLISPAEGFRRAVNQSVMKQIIERAGLSIEDN